MSVDFHFLNVGSGDCTIVHFPQRTRGDVSLPERVMLVDLCTHKDHDDYEDVINYYKAHFRNNDGTYKPIFRYICTHPHQDHICGLKELFDDNAIAIINFWDLDTTFVPADFDGHPTHEEDWGAYKTLGGSSSPATVLRYTRETTPSPFWDNNGDRITILAPSAALLKHAHYKDDGTRREPNAVEVDEASYALAIRINDRTVILAGDGRKTPVWDDIYANCKTILPSCYVLKAGHHGHDSAFHEDAVKLMSPIVIVLSNSKEEDEANGAEAKYVKACPNARICRTWEGTVLIKVPFDKDKPITIG